MRALKVRERALRLHTGATFEIFLGAMIFLVGPFSESRYYWSHCVGIFVHWPFRGKFF